MFLPTSTSATQRPTRHRIQSFDEGFERADTLGDLDADVVDDLVHGVVVRQLLGEQEALVGIHASVDFALQAGAPVPQAALTLSPMRSCSSQCSRVPGVSHNPGADVALSKPERSRN